jgi:hypothetical protein
MPLYNIPYLYNNQHDTMYKIPHTYTYLIGICYTVITILQNIYEITAEADIH